eukprot:scaffold22529_cov61-Phaeocystis_antarctica.AAC.4
MPMVPTARAQAALAQASRSRPPWMGSRVEPNALGHAEGRLVRSSCSPFGWANSWVLGLKQSCAHTHSAPHPICRCHTHSTQARTHQTPDASLSVPHMRLTRRPQHGRPQRHGPCVTGTCGQRRPPLRA